LAPREKLGAELDRVGVEQGVSFAEYLALVAGEYPDDEAPSPGDFAGNGIAVLVHAKLTGFEDRSYSVHVFTYDAESSIRIYPDEQPGLLLRVCDYKSPQAREDSVAWICWMAAPPEGVEFFVRAHLYEVGPSLIKPGGPAVDSEFLDFIDSPAMVSTWGEEQGTAG
jgi:hypothetical protein